MKSKLTLPTRAIHSTINQESGNRPVSQPLYLSTTYHRNPDGTYNNDYLYSRADNPNRRTVETAIAELEGGETCYAFASGMAATAAVFQSLKANDHVLIPDDAYFNVVLLLREVMQRWQLTYTVVDMSDLEAVTASFQPNTSLVWLETPSNPLLKLTDIEAVSKLAKQHGSLVAVDNTWPTPVLTRPLELGADLVVHSTTKYFGGHSDVLSGCVVVKTGGEVAQRIHQIQKYGGGVPSPFDCWLIARGIQTLPLRINTQTTTAHALAEFLEEHPQIEKVIYPGLRSHPQHELAKRLMPNGFGAMLSVLIKGDAARTDEVANNLNLFTVATSLGGVESLIERRKAVEGPDSTTPENLLRLSIGLESLEDLKNDWVETLC